MADLNLPLIQPKPNVYCPVNSVHGFREVKNRLFSNSFLFDGKLPLPSLVQTPAVRCMQYLSLIERLQNSLDEAAACRLEPHPHYFCFCYKR